MKNNYELAEITKIWKVNAFKEFFTILESEIDTTVKEDCYFIDKFHWENSKDLQYNKIISIWGKPYEWMRLIYYISDFSDGTHLHYITSNSLLNEREDYQKTNQNTWEKRYKILWKFPTNSIILKYIEKVVWWIWNLSDRNIPYIEEYYREINPYIKEPLDMNEDEIKKVVNYLKDLNKKFLEWKKEN